MLLSISLPIPPPQTVFVNGLPLGSIEAVKGASGELVQILDPPKDGYNLTMKLNFTKLPQDEGMKSFSSADNQTASKKPTIPLRDVLVGGSLWWRFFYIRVL
ncbi:hypothetical protein KFK09_023593 [Dendrobium nobile]|uniref:Uncharacterized protein n=1 Tax=Dendrobium nobile TaxID=94219 RepID=A0A8T3AGW3_DENNO|nr:hypothetical protein KFK09_023593 [Dendrobium nobile]